MGILDGFVKSPSAALRFPFVAAAYGSPSIKGDRSDPPGHNFGCGLGTRAVRAGSIGRDTPGPSEVAELPPEKAGGVTPAPAREKSVPYGSQRTALAPRPWTPLADNTAEPAPTWVAHPSLKGYGIRCFSLDNCGQVSYFLCLGISMQGTRSRLFTSLSSHRKKILQGDLFAVFHG
jgi:hypothetical protein